MDSILLQESLLGETTNAAAHTAAQAASFIQGNWAILLTGIILIAATILVLYVLKRVIINSILGVVAWLIITYALPFFGLKISLPFIPSLIVSAIFGLAGIGVMLVLAFMGII